MIWMLWACSGVKIEGEVDTGEKPTGDTSVVDTADGDSGEPTETGNPETGGGDTDSGEVVDTGSPYSCDALPELPLSYDSTGGWSGAEDFTFDGEGYLVSVDNGSLTRRNRDGDELVVRPGLGETAGIQMLPSGTEVAYASVSGGAVNRISLEDGGSDTLLGGLSYPNGIEVGSDDYVYVAEHSGGRVHRVHTESLESEVLATGMVAPNGIAFGPDEQTLYWGSFGNGSIYAVDREGDGFGEPYLFGYTPDSQTYWSQVSDPCGGKAEGDGCYGADAGIGTCAQIADQLACEPIDLFGPCEEKAAGDSCSHEVLGETVESLCVETGPPVEPLLACPTVPATELEACAGLTVGDACDGGECMESWDGALVCSSLEAEVDARAVACEGVDEHATCTVESSVSPFTGVCREGEVESDLVCTSKPSSYGSHGGLDGLNVDRCGNVYVTEYVYGYLWKIGPEGGAGELAVNLPSSWIPNMHWGNGVGEWEEDVLYVMDRNYGGWGGADVYEVHVEIEGVTQAFTP